MKKDQNAGTVFIILSLTWFILAATQETTRITYLVIGLAFAVIGVALTPWGETKNPPETKTPETSPEPPEAQPQQKPDGPDVDNPPTNQVN